MANVRAFRTGNWSDTTATSPWWDGTAIYAPEAGDVVYANSFNITVDTSATTGAITNVSATSRLWKDGATTTAAAGGSFTLSHGVTLTADLNSPNNVILCRLAGADSANIVGRIQGATAINTNTVLNSGTGVLAITGDVETVGAPGGAFCVNNSGAGTIAITGNVSGAGQGVGNSSSGSFIITGNVTGAFTAGATNSSTGVFTITGNVTAGASTPGATNSSTGIFTIIGDIAASNGAAGFTSPNASATNRLCGSFIAAPNGTAAVYATKFILNNPPLMAKSRYSLNGAGEYVDMFTADNSVFGQPATTDVRAGTVYAGGTLTGSCAVPAAGSVALGVPVDNTTGTAALTPEAVWAHATRTLTAGAGITAADVWSHAARTVTGGTVDTLTNAPAVPSATTIAAAVRTELTELAHLDAPVSTRSTLTAGDIPSSDIAAIKAKTDALDTERLAQAATTHIVGKLLEHL